MDDDCEVVVAGLELEVVVEVAAELVVDVDCLDVVEVVEMLEEVAVEIVVDVVGVVEAETVNCACTCTFAYLGGSLTVTYTVYRPWAASTRRVNWSRYAPVRSVSRD